MLVFIGIQASGKTSFYLQRFFDTHVRISMDLLKTRHRESLFIRACLASGQRCVIDNTNPTVEERALYIGMAKQSGFRVAGYFFEPDPSACAERNQRRPEKQRVPPAGLFGTLKRLQRPRRDEGFDELFLVKAANGMFDVAQLP
ncbi:MAG TPA: ATP-binding protein [Noviherbaspirillum sp.]|uniref:ATP-binding protein n=1 Tax=Noviherbaspirillum sp. TaxID=1926288 RepID=UPI002D592817|nr:ATP-binding protein [Noviherbaspirillum sp.]HYD93814.1 ATP-binding protein [Noviherbaspirillum sp.]